MTATVTPLNAHDPTTLALAHDVMRRVTEHDLESPEGRADAQAAITRNTGKLYVKILRQVAFALGQGMPAQDRATVTRQAADMAIMRVRDGDVPEER